MQLRYTFTRYNEQTDEETDVTVDLTLDIASDEYMGGHLFSQGGVEVDEVTDPATGQPVALSEAELRDAEIWAGLKVGSVGARYYPKAW